MMASKSHEVSVFLDVGKITDCPPKVEYVRPILTSTDRGKQNIVVLDAEKSDDGGNKLGNSKKDKHWEEWGRGKETI